VIGLVGAVGTPLDLVHEKLAQSFSRVAYKSVPIHLSGLLKSLPKLPFPISEFPEFQRIRTSMAAGTGLREKLKRADALAGLAVSQIKVERERLGGTFEGRAYVLRQLKHHDEAGALRDVYRDQFILLGVYMPRGMRVSRLAERLARSEGKKSDDLRASAEELIATDEREAAGRPMGQDVRQTFPLSDVFVNARDPGTLEKELDRFVDILFGRPCMTPTKDECGLFHAQAAAFRSAALGRQVGAALTNHSGDLLSVGMNEVPKAGGGHYWHGDSQDGRDFKRGFDQNDQLKASVLREVLVTLRTAGWLQQAQASASVESLVSSAVTVLKDTRLLNLTEFGREVHAEVSAILSAARLGIATAGSILYTTTFPCHNCAKHIVAAGISKVVYIEPYAKSFAEDFHPDSIDVEADTPLAQRVLFEPFVGVSPRKYQDWFRAGPRKDAVGKVLEWKPPEQPPIFSRPGTGGIDIGMSDRENALSSAIDAGLQKEGLI
jgi:deoxycytidylate deaminase